MFLIIIYPKIQTIGENNIATIYNVGQIKADNIPNGNIVSAIGSKTDMLSANNSIINFNERSNKNFPANNSNTKFSVPDDDEIGIEALSPTINKKWKYS